MVNEHFLEVKEGICTIYLEIYTSRDKTLQINVIEGPDRITCRDFDNLDNISGLTPSLELFLRCLTIPSFRSEFLWKAMISEAKFNETLSARYLGGSGAL